MIADEFEKIREIYRKAAQIVIPDLYLPASFFNYPKQEIPASSTHTMHIDHYGKVTYNDLPDKEKAPVI